MTHLCREGDWLAWGHRRPDITVDLGAGVARGRLPLCTYRSVPRVGAGILSSNAARIPAPGALASEATRLAAS
jgi:hypothetical protein